METKVEARAVAKYVRVTPRKANQVLGLIRGKRVDVVTEILDFTPKHVAKVIGRASCRERVLTDV